MTYYLIIRGPLGIGKTTIAALLAEKLSAKHISIDRIVDDPRLITPEREQGYISQNSFLQANRIIIPRAIKHLDKGIPVVFDGNFYWKSQIDDLISRLDYPHHVFTLKAPLSVCIKRDGNREKTHGKDAAEAVYKKSTSFSYGNVIDTENKTPEQVIDEIKRYIK